MSMVDDVSWFQHCSEQLSVDDPNAPSNLVELYSDLIKEEYKELQEAISSGDQAHILNEALDLVWVTLGFCNAQNFETTLAWDTLLHSNMSKLQKDPVTGKLLRNEKGKIQKPKDWKKPDYSPFVSPKNNGGL